MAGYGLNDLRVAASHEESGLKQIIAFAWEAMKRTNWDDTKFCTINPILMMSYSMAKSFQGFYNNEGWDVVIKRKDRNYCFDIYRVD
jgi:hypothetical protein